VQRRHPGLGEEERSTAHSWLAEVRCFFADVCTWATEEGSPFAAFAPSAVPLERHDLRNRGLEQARRRQAKRQLATILDLEPVVELAEQPQRTVALALLELEIRSQPDRHQLAEQRGPGDRCVAQAPGTDVGDGRIVRDPSGRDPTPP
jgi:hypothetical protein